jgi:DNA-binding IclR family transcriptional regulator
VSGTKATSTQRALAVLDCFSTDAPALTLSEIARRLDQPVSSTHRQVGELARWGALERDERGRYRIGLHLWEVGSLAPRSKGLREASLPFLEDLYEATHENVQVAVLDNTEVLYVERIFGHHATRIIARPGARLPLHATGVGQVLLAHSSMELINNVLSAPLKRFTRHTMVNPEELRRELASIRKAGYAISDRQVELVSTSVAAPIRGSDNVVVAALSIIIPSSGDSARRFVPAVLAAARGISRALGAPVTPSTSPAPAARRTHSVPPHFPDSR